MHAVPPGGHHPRTVDGLVRSVQVARWLLLAVLAAAALLALGSARSAPGAPATVLAAALSAYAVLAAVPLWWVTRRLVDALTRDDGDADPSAPLAAVIPLRTSRQLAG